MSTSQPSNRPQYNRQRSVAPPPDRRPTIVAAITAFLLLATGLALASPATADTKPGFDAQPADEIAYTTTTTTVTRPAQLAGQTTTTVPTSFELGDREQPEVRFSPRKQVDGLAAPGGHQRGSINNCFVGFDDPAVIAILPDQAITNVVHYPYYNQECLIDGTAIAIEPIGDNHYHMGYVDTSIRWCFDLGTFGRPDDPEDLSSPCSPIDPLTEPRIGVQPHSINYGIRIYAYEFGSGTQRVNFDLNELKIVSGQAEVCFQRTDLPWITSKPTDQAAGYCGETGVGTWDVTGVTDAYEVRIWARSAGMNFTDIGITV